MAEFTAARRLPDNIPDDLTIPQFFLHTDHPERPARPETVPFFIDDATGRKVLPNEVRQRTRHLANGLKVKYSIGDNDVVCMFSPNNIDYPIVVWATHTLGAIVSPSNPAYTVDELVHQLSMTNARLIICFSGFLPTALEAAKTVGLPQDRIVVVDKSASPEGFVTIEELVSLGRSRPQAYQDVRLRAGDGKSRLAFLSFSSGTTGKAKAVKIPHYAVIANVVQLHIHCNDKRIKVGSVCTGVLPLFHIYGLVVTLHNVLFAGGTMVVMPKFNFLDYLASIQHYRITHLFVVPPQVVLLTKRAEVRNYDLSHVEYVMCGAAPLSGQLVLHLKKILPKAAIGQGYGLTESATTITCFPPEQEVGTIGSAGKLIPGMRAKVLKEDGSWGGEGEQGELVVTGPAIALGYLNNEKATNETFKNGWLHTGDEVVFKNDEVFIVDRLKEIMKVKGFQVAPAELEGHLMLHPAVADACVVGVIIDDYSGEAPLAFVALQPAFKERLLSPSETKKLKQIISKHVSDNKIKYKWLTGGVEFVDTIPKNPSGKILRRVLREQARQLKRSELVHAKL